MARRQSKKIEKPEYLRDFDVYPSYKGGHTCTENGYVWEFVPGHHLQNNWGWVAQHRLVAEDKIGRRLIQSTDDTICEAVHHMDENRKNNAPANLQIMTCREHIVLHGRQSRERSLAPITAEKVAAALEGRTLKDAARLLKVDSMTLRNRFPELLEPRKRKAPANLDHPALIEAVRPLAADPEISLRDAHKKLGISIVSVQRICEKNSIQWVNKGRNGMNKNGRRHLKKAFLDDPATVDMLRPLLLDPTKNLNDIAAETGLSVSQIGRVQRRHDLPLIPKGRSIEKQIPRRKKRKKPIFRWREEAHGSKTEPAQLTLLPAA